MTKIYIIIYLVSWLNDKVINNFLQAETRKKDIAIVYTNFFVDDKSQRISDKVLRVLP